MPISIKLIWRVIEKTVAWAIEFTGFINADAINLTVGSSSNYTFRKSLPKQKTHWSMLDKTLLNQLYRFAISLCHNEDQAYDLLQSCVEKYLKADRSKIEKPVAYLMRLIRNEFIDETRRRRFSYEVDAETLGKISDEAALGEMSLEDVYIQQCEVEALLGTMCPEERELLFLWAVEEYTIAEIAQLKQVPRGTLLSKLHRLKRRIQLQQSSDNVLSMRVKS